MPSGPCSGSRTLDPRKVGAVTGTAAGFAFRSIWSQVALPIVQMRAQSPARTMETAASRYVRAASSLGGERGGAGAPTHATRLAAIARRASPRFRVIGEGSHQSGPSGRVVQGATSAKTEQLEVDTLPPAARVANPQAGDASIIIDGRDGTGVAQGGRTLRPALDSAAFLGPPGHRADA